MMPPASDDEFDDFDLGDDLIAEQSLAQIEQEHALRTGQGKQPIKQTLRNVGVDDFRVSHKGRVAPGQNLPRPDDEIEDDSGDARWQRMDLDSIEQHAIATSQSSSQSVRRADASQAPGKRPRGRDEESDPQPVPKSRPRLEGEYFAERQGDSERIQQLMKELEAKDEELKRLKGDSFKKAGEITMIRTRFNRSLAEHSALYKEKEEDLAKQRALVRELQQTVENKDSELKTVQTFRGFEANTSSNHLWSHVSASVARRRGQQSIQRDYSQSHSQTAAAAAGLITPTRRNRGQAGRALDSPTSGRASRERGAGDESPSARRSKHVQVASTPFRDVRSASVQKKAAIPGFVNSFAHPAVPTPKVRAAKTSTDVLAEQSQSQSLDIARPATPDAADDVDFDIRSADRAAVTTRGSRQTVVEQYNWAVSTYTRRQTFLLSLVISHKSLPCPSPGSPSRVCPEPLTLQRLMQSPVSSDDDAYLHREYMTAVQYLFHSLTSGSALDAEDRFAFLREEMNADHRQHDEHPQDGDDLAPECMELMDLGLNEVLTEVGIALRVMMAVALHVGSVERLYDVLVLMRSIAIHYASMTRLLIIAPCSGLVESMSEDFGPDVEKHCETQRHLKFALDQVAVACISRVYLLRTSKKASSVDNKRMTEGVAGSTTTAKKGASTKPSEEADRALIQAVLGHVELLALEVQHNDSVSLACLQTIRSVLGRPDILASLLAGHQDASIIRRVLGIITLLARHDSFWQSLLACPLQELQGLARLPHHVRANVPASRQEEYNLFILFSRILLDGRRCIVDDEMHAVHAAIIGFLQQLIVCHPDAALPLVAKSGVLIAAIVKCLYDDTDAIWNEASAATFRAEFSAEDIERYVRATLRIETDVRFLADVYIIAFDQHKNGRPVSDAIGGILAEQLTSTQNQYLLNGFRHYFFVAMSRVAFASEPEWMLAEEMHEENNAQSLKATELLEAARNSISSISEAAADLLELVFTPDEIESSWEALNEEEPEEEDEDELAAADAAAQADVHMSQSKGKPRGSQRSQALEHKNRHKDDAAIVVSDTEDEAERH